MPKSEESSEKEAQERFEAALRAGTETTPIQTAIPSLSMNATKRSIARSAPARSRAR